MAVDPVLQLPSGRHVPAREELDDARIRIESGKNIVKNQFVLGMGQRTVSLGQEVAYGPWWH